MSKYVIEAAYPEDNPSTIAGGWIRFSPWLTFEEGEEVLMHEAMLAFIQRRYGVDHFDEYAKHAIRLPGTACMRTVFKVQVK